MFLLLRSDASLLSQPFLGDSYDLENWREHERHKKRHVDAKQVVLCHEERRNKVDVILHSADRLHDSE